MFSESESESRSVSAGIEAAARSMTPRTAGGECLVFKVAAARKKDDQLAAEPVEQKPRAEEKKQVGGHRRAHGGAPARHAELILKKSAGGLCDRAERDAEHDGQGKGKRMDKENKNGCICEKKQNVRRVVPPKCPYAFQRLTPVQIQYARRSGRNAKKSFAARVFGVKGGGLMVMEESGCGAELEQLVERYTDTLFRISYSMCGVVADALRAHPDRMEKRRLPRVV